MLCLALTSLMWSTGCATVRSSSVVCPPLIGYTEAFQMRAADEVEKLPEGSALLTLIIDYGQLRDQIRACKTEGSK